MGHVIEPAPRSTPLAGSITCPMCRGQRPIRNTIPNISNLFGLEEIWYLRPLHKVIQAYSPPGWPRPHGNYIEWSGKPLRPISEKEVGYFGKDVFDYEDQVSERSKKRLEDDVENKKLGSSTVGIQTEPNFEDLLLPSVQEMVENF